MPHSVSLKLEEFVKDIRSGGEKVAALLCGLACPRCGEARLRLTRTQVARGAVLLDGTVRVAVPLARCGACGGRTRVLPADLLPYKTYSLPVIELFVSAYVSGRRGLRSTVGEAETRATRPHFTTLHGWCGGLGERALDQVKLRQVRAELVQSQRGLAPFSALIQEVDTRRGAPAAAVFSRQVRVPPQKHRSSRRREHLEADLRTLHVASVIPRRSRSAEEGSLLELERIGLGALGMPMLLFRSRIRDTPIQQADRRGRVYHRSSRTRSRSHGSPRDRPLAL